MRVRCLIEGCSSAEQFISEADKEEEEEEDDGIGSDAADWTRQDWANKENKEDDEQKKKKKEKKRKSNEIE